MACRREIQSGLLYCSFEAQLLLPQDNLVSAPKVFSRANECEGFLKGGSLNLQLLHVASRKLEQDRVSEIFLGILPPPIQEYI